MTSATDETYRLKDAPVDKDRTAGWSFLRNLGDGARDADGAWLLTSPEAVQFALRQPRIFSSARAFDLLAGPVRLVPLAADPPEHKKFRRVLDRLLAPRALDAIEDSLRAQARELIEAFADRGECDVMRDLGQLFPPQVFLTMAGMPLEDRGRLIAWTHKVLESASSQDEPDPEVIESSGALFAYCRDILAQKRRRPGDDLISHILAVQGDEAWSDEEVLGVCLLFCFAGLDTVTSAIGFTMYHLATRPELRRELVADLSRVTTVIEEILRLEAPSPFVLRVTTEDVQVAGLRIPAGSQVRLCLATANRDPGTYDRPHEIDLHREQCRHLTFSTGIHRCLGAHLARRELRLMLEEFHKLIPEYQLGPGADPQVVWPANTLHLTSVPLVFP
jgi:cytochrome P450